MPVPEKLRIFTSSPQFRPTLQLGHGFVHNDTRRCVALQDVRGSSSCCPVAIASMTARQRGPGRKYQVRTRAPVPVTCRPLYRWSCPDGSRLRGRRKAWERRAGIPPHPLRYARRPLSQRPQRARARLWEARLIRNPRFWRDPSRLAAASRDHENIRRLDVAVSDASGMSPPACAQFGWQGPAAC